MRYAPGKYSSYVSDLLNIVVDSTDNPVRVFVRDLF